MYLIFEFLAMDLKKYIDQLPDGEMMDKITLKSYMFQICQAMCFCHQVSRIALIMFYTERPFPASRYTSRFEAAESLGGY